MESTAIQLHKEKKERREQNKKEMLVEVDIWLEKIRSKIKDWKKNMFSLKQEGNMKKSRMMK